MKIRNTKALAWATLAAGFAGCTSVSNHPALDAMKSASKGLGDKNFVEAYVEYRGPSEKWSGPASFLMHVVAKGNDPVKISFTPAFAAEPANTLPTSPIHEMAPTMSGRRPAGEVSKTPVAAASAAPSHAPSSAPKAMTGEVARNHINQLAAAVQAGDVAFEGCLSPVRVRLIRADGAVLEKQGCRSVEGWPKAASEVVGQFMPFAGS